MGYTSLQAHKIVQQASHILQQEQGAPHCLDTTDFPATASAGSLLLKAPAVLCCMVCGGAFP